jgi:hypothetical protein
MSGVVRCENRAMLRMFRLLTNPIILMGFVFGGEISVERVNRIEKLGMESQLIDIGR